LHQHEKPRTDEMRRPRRLAAREGEEALRSHSTGVGGSGHAMGRWSGHNRFTRKICWIASVLLGPLSGDS
jgi:hypothetical protein